MRGVLLAEIGANAMYVQTNTSAEPSKEAIQRALEELGELCRSEYGSDLDQLVRGKDDAQAAAKLERITGIALKRKFAKREKRSGFSYTGAEYAWPWTDTDPDKVPNSKPEADLLEELRAPGPWNKDPAAGGSTSWAQFKADAEHERSLFKVLALYVNDKLEGNSKRSFRRYVAAPESRNVEAGLDLATLVAEAAIIGPILAWLHVPSVAVGVALVGIRFGYRLFDDSLDDGGDATK